MLISGSPIDLARRLFSAVIDSRVSFCKPESMPLGLLRYSTGSLPLSASSLHALIDRRQEAAAPAGITTAWPFGAGTEDDEPGQVFDSLPSPYRAHAPKLGRPNCCAPVFIINWPGAWLNASVASDRTMAMSSTIAAVCGNSSDTSAPHLPWRANSKRGPRNFEPGLMNAAR